MKKLDLPLVKGLTTRNLKHRVPHGMTLTDVGFFEEVDPYFESLGFANVFRVEARFGAQLQLDPRLPKDVEERTIQRIKLDILRHVYGPIHSELRDIYTQMLLEGRPTRARESVANLLDQLDDVFSGKGSHE